MSHQNELKRTLDWFKEAKPQPNQRDLSTQIGCHFEEVVEMLDALGYTEMAHRLEIIADSYKQNQQTERLQQLTHQQKVEVLDSLADQVVTATGVAYMAGFDFNAAFAEVNASNWSKFENGKAIFDENGKIKKGKNYFKPNLQKFVPEA